LGIVTGTLSQIGWKCIIKKELHSYNIVKILQGVRKILPDPKILSNRDERESCSPRRYWTFVQFNAYTVTRLCMVRLFY